MTHNLAIVAEFLIATAMLAGGLIVIGYPIKVFVLDGRERRSPVLSVVAGLAALQIVGWYWNRAGGEGLRTPTLVLLAAGAIGTVAALIRRGVRRPRLADLPPWVAAAGIALVFFLVYASVFALPFHTTATLGNNDAVAYSLYGQHLADHGFGDEGPIAGTDLGHQVKVDAFGSSVVLGATAAVTGIDTWKLTTALMLILAIVAAMTLARLLAELFPDAPVQGALVAVAACSVYLFNFVVTQYFLGQVMSTAVAPILATVALQSREVTGWRSAVRPAASVAVVAVVFISHYIHMLAPMLLLAGAAALVASGRDFRSALPRIAGVLGAGTVAAAVLVPELLALGVDRMRGLADLPAGWPLPGFLPSEIAGALSSSLSTPHGAGGYAASVLLLAGWAAALIALRNTRPRAALFAGVTVWLILISYLVVFQRSGGESYRQWKWIASFTPLYVAFVFMPVIMSLTDRAAAHRLRYAVPGSCLAATALVVMVVWVSGLARSPVRMTTDAAPPQDHFIYVDPELANLRVNPRLAGIDAINVNVLPGGWDTMWAAYFLRDHKLYLQGTSYFPTTPPTADWTLAPRNDSLVSPSIEPVNKRFQIERRFTGPTSTEKSGLAARIAPAVKSIDVSAAQGINFPVEVTNTGSAAWLAPGGDPHGAVSLAVTLQAADGTEISRDYYRQAVVPFRTLPIPPGAKATTPVTPTTPAPGRYRMRLQLVSEGVASFGSPVTVDLTVRP